MSITREWDWIRVSTLAVSVGLLGLALYSKPAVTAAPALTVTLAADVPIYSGRLADGWQDWSWAKHNLQSADVNHQGHVAIRMDADKFTGVYLHTDGLNTRGYKALWVWVHGGSSGGQQIDVAAADTGKNFGPRVELGASADGGKIPAGKWTLAIIPLKSLNAADTTITGFVFQDKAGKPQGPLYLTDIKLVGDASIGPAAVSVTVDTSQDVHPISPYIYGLAHTTPEIAKSLRIGSHRWGGNPNSRYNWEVNAWNHARDWEFSNYGDQRLASRVPGVVADGFVLGNKSAGIATLLTVPTIGYVAKDVNDSSRSLNVPKGGGPPVSMGSEAIPDYNPAENQRRTSVKSYPRKGKPFRDPPDIADNAVYQDEWINHLVRKFGKASEGGVRFYAMDNEADLWDGTHTDVHPVRMSYDDILTNFLEYATAVKEVDPSAQVTGPVSWGWTGYFHSPRDRDNWNARPDRKAHGDLPLIPWFLEQVKKHDQRTGRRSLDILDVHFYPQGAGVYEGKTDAATDALRIRSTRGLWDPTYKDESWIGEPVNLLPRMKDWINQYYPGTGLGLTEWNFGADSTINGAIAIAESLGTFGRENLAIANYWTTPKDQSPGYFAFKIFRNADGRGGGFGDKSVKAVSTAPNEISCFASVDSISGQPVIIVVNKQPDKDTAITIKLNHGKSVTTASGWRYGEQNPTEISRLPDMTVTNSLLVMQAPRYSVTLLRLR
jgi:hypothetical protein